ncbi:MAG: phytanoyl-CoA dioxygenase family protein [Candidatus Eremiobacteraeota bacterium]|nr:phytanoyl-CoA dioxygenase family protein [Candidatus Eremiobacteraeota bacterium]MBV9646949.1 phytanoyl-CoA dioxygenase family protein [Candidatus Eremiobacteraeota bacterium]
MKTHERSTAAAAGNGPAGTTLAALRRDGYAVLPGVLQSRQLSEIRAAIERALIEARRDPLWRTGGTLHLDVQALPEVATVLSSTAITSAVGCILGPAARPSRVHFRAPLPGHGAQALHPDWSEPIVPNGEQVATVIVALVDFTVDNGATRVVPGSHLLPRLAVPKEPSVAFPGERIVTCTAGDAVVFSGHLRHSGTKNGSTQRRDALQILFTR